MTDLGKLVAVRYLDGHLEKGRTADFKPGCDVFHIRQKDGTLLKIVVKGLKAVFFIKTLEGDPQHEERKDHAAKSNPERPIWLEFTDGEALAGWSSALGKPEGFYFTPTDPDSNLERAFVFRPAVRRLLQGEAAEQAAAEYRLKSPHLKESAGKRVYKLD